MIIIKRFKDYKGISKNGYKAITSTGETDTTGNQKILISNGKRFLTISANKFIAGWIPLDDKERRESYLSRGHGESVKRLSNGMYMVQVSWGGKSRRRTFSSEILAKAFLEKAREKYIDTGKLIQNVREKHRTVGNVYKTNSLKRPYVFDFSIDGKRYRKAFKDMNSAVKFNENFLHLTNERDRKEAISKRKNSTHHLYIHEGHSSIYFEKTLSGKRYRKGFAKSELKKALDYRNDFLKRHGLPIPNDREDKSNEQH